MGSALALLTAVLVFTLFWLDSARARELATALARTMCDRRGLQLLDDTVDLRRMGLRWGRQGLRFRRMFGFDFSLGDGHRRTGYLILVGTEVEQYSLGLPEEPAPEVSEPVPEESEPAPQKTNRAPDKVVPFRRPDKK